MKLVKVGSSQGCLGKNIGCEKAPDEIVKKVYDYYLSEDGGKLNLEIDEINVIRDNFDKTNENILEKEGDVFIGGDHSITYSCFKNFCKNFNNPGLLVFDAHPDIYPEDILNHENWLFHLIKDGMVKKENVILVGIRNWHEKELNFLRENKIKFFTMKQVYEDKEGICDGIMESLRNFDAFYLSVDIDVVDPSFAPGTGYIEPGGLSSRDLIYFLHRLKILKNLRRVDLVEINPDKDINQLTVKLGGKIIAELI